MAAAGPGIGSAGSSWRTNYFKAVKSRRTSIAARRRPKISQPLTQDDAVSYDQFRGEGSFFEIPIVTTISAGTASRPVPPFRWRLLRQVSLRTCLILLTLGCLWLGLVSQRAREQRLAVDRIVARGGHVRYDYECNAQGLVLKVSKPRWIWLRSLVGHGYLDHVVRVSLDKTAVSDADMQVIGKLRGVRTLSLNDTSVSDETLKHVSAWHELNYLGLSGTRVTGEGLRHIERMQSLDTLVLEKSNVDDRGIKSLAKLRRLESLSLDGTTVTSATIAPLSTLPLVTLGLQQTAVDDAAIGHLCRMKKLDWLMLNSSRISGEGLLKVQDALPDCQVDGDLVDLSSLGGTTEPPEGYWGRLVTGRLIPLHDEGRLKLIDLSTTTFADRDLRHLEGLTRLEMIDLRETKVTEAGVESLRQSLPGCKIAR